MRGQTGTPVGTVATDDGLALALGSAGEVSGVSADGEVLGPAADRPTGLLLRDATLEGPPLMAGGTLRAEGGAVHQSARVESLGLALEASWRSSGDHVEVEGLVRDLRGEDRAVTVYLALPLAEADWQWWDSAAVARTAGDEGAELSSLETGMQFGLNGAHSRYPVGAVSWPGHGGLTLGVRMDEPVVHRIAYSPALRLLYLALDFGLVPETNLKGRSLSEASFRVLIYRHDPAWGMRSALQRYYDMLPELFTRRTEREGGWYVWGNMADTEGALEAGFGFHWGPRGNDAIRWDNEQGVTNVLYIEPEHFQLTMGDWDHAPTAEEALRRLGLLAAGDEQELEAYKKLGYSRSYVPGNWVAEHSLDEAIEAVTRAAEVSGEWDGAMQPIARVGQYSWIGDSKWGIIFPCNLDPDLPDGKGWFCRQVFIDSGLRAAEQAGVHYDGVGLDSFGGYGQASRANYRREHFQYTDIPLSFSAAEHAPVLVAVYSSLEWLRDLAADMHGEGKILMANCAGGRAPAWLTFAAPYLDVFGAEAPKFGDPDYIRAIAYRKACTDLPYKPQPDWELPWHLLHGIYPGAGNELEAMKPLAEPLRTLAQAGWEPITGARVEPPDLRLERYGSGATVYLVVHNPGEEQATARIAIDPTVLGAGPFAASDLLTDAPLVIEGATVTVDLPPQGTVAI
ncbi:MAG TPA: hypothetical protein VM283_05040, partial [Armatimonadota bacterium]|nr:hypothetical protein [Armatimonadota bacterium]